MIHDQADELRQLVRQRAATGPVGPVAPLIVVSGGKGGVGTTTVAVNLAIALARQGRRAVFVDADLDHGGHWQLGQQPERGSLADVLAGRRGVHEVIQRGPSGIQVLQGAWPAEQLQEVSPQSQTRLIEALHQVTPHGEIVVVDAGSGRAPLARRFWQAAAGVLVLATPEQCAITECYAAIKVLAAEGAGQLYTLVNQAPAASLASDIQARIATACRKFLGVDVASAGHLAPCPTRGLEPLVFAARSEPARAMDRLAGTLWAQQQLSMSRELKSARAVSRGSSLATQS